MKKIVLKAVAVTVGALAALAIIIFTLWILIAPQSMATASERVGNFSFAVTCAELKFKYSGDTRDLARCAQDSILSGDDKLIAKHCGALVQKSDFNEICKAKNDELAKTLYGAKAEDYRTYILSNLSVAQYRVGNLSLAIETAQSGEAKCFKKLVITVVERGSDEEKRTVARALEKYDDEDAKVFIQLLNK